jgi:hypothetical protein
MKQIFYLIITFCALLLSGCGKPAEVSQNVESNSPSTTVNTATNTAEELEKSEKAKNEIVSSTQKLKDLKFWSAKTMSDTSPLLNGEMKFEAPDRFYLKQGENEAIVIGKDSYIKEDGKWVRSKEDLSGLMALSRDKMSDEVIRKIKNVRVIGNAQVNGKETTLYEHKINENGVQITNKLWVATGSGLLIKSERETKIGNRLNRLSIYFDYEKPVEIEAPKIE